MRAPRSRTRTTWCARWRGADHGRAQRGERDVEHLVPLQRLGGQIQAQACQGVQGRGRSRRVRAGLQAHGVGQVRDALRGVRGEVPGGHRAEGSAHHVRDAGADDPREDRPSVQGKPGVRDHVARRAPRPERPARAAQARRKRVLAGLHTAHKRAGMGHVQPRRGQLRARREPLQVAEAGGVEEERRDEDLEQGRAQPLPGRGVRQAADLLRVRDALLDRHP